MIHTAKNDKWTDSAGLEIPYSRVTRIERQKESAASKLLKTAQDISAQLLTFKNLIQQACESFYKEALKEHKAEKKERKGSYTWYNFDRSVKIEVNATERVDFKNPEIDLAKEKLDSFISDGLSNTEEIIRQLVNDAFSNTKGNLDPKRVLGLLKYRSKTKAVKFHEALDLIEKSIDRSKSKTYYKIAVKAENGEYEYIKLNFSDI